MKLFLFALCSGLIAAVSAQNFKTNEIKKHVKYLASDKLKGRGTGSEGERLAADYISKHFAAVGLTALGGDYKKPFTFRYNPDPHDTSVGKISKSASNVVGYLDNGAPFTIVIGAHYDHLGLGADKNSLEANPEGKVHNGADDNASGTAGVLELARYYSKNKEKEPYNFLFICFSGEELGLMGSKKWCEQPDIPLSNINYMINMDMIGRLNDTTKKVIVYGVGTSPSFVPILDSIQSALVLKKDSSGTGPSDQTSFYLRDIPVLHFFTGQHSDYHKPSDDFDKLNYEGEAQVLEFISTFINITLKRPKMAFLRTRSPESARVSFKVTLGVMPDYAFEGKGMRIDGVSDNRPAAKAGLLRGDIIVKLGGDDVSDVHAYMKALSKFKKGDTTEVEVDRGGQRKQFSVTF
jgi:hypothetical protein